MSQTTEYVAPAGAPAPQAPWLGPKVDLTPGVIREDAKVSKAKGLMVACAIGAIAVVGGLYLLALGSQSAAQADLDAAKAEQAALAQQADALAEVPATAAALRSAQTALSTAMVDDVQWSLVLNDLARFTPEGVSFTTVSLTPATADQASSGAIGSMSFAGESKSFPGVSAFLDSLARQPIYADPTLAGATRDTTATTGASVRFQAGAAVTDEALSHRFDPSKGGTP